ncbi:cytochrome c [bacterium]|nr:cytochrome c [bacterium]MBU1884456.1 cytochrome c [bacterium]
MKINLLWIMMLGSVPLFAATMSGQALFEEKCAVCHTKEKPTPEIRATMIAPPAMGLMFNLKKTFNNDKQASLAFMQDYAVAPSAEKAKCMPQAIKRFGLMPSLKGSVTPEELALITEYMYDTFPPSGFQPLQLNMKP